MDDNANNSWPRLGGFGLPGDGPFEELPIKSGVSSGDVHVLQHTLTTGLPHEYARLYLVIRLVDGFESPSVVLERAVLVVGPSHSQRSNSGTSPSRDLAGAILNVLQLLDKLYDKDGGALCFPWPGSNITIHGVLDAIVFTDFQDEMRKNGLLSLLTDSDDSENGYPLLLSYFKRKRRGVDGVWQPCTSVYCDWAPNRSFGDEASGIITQQVEGNEKYMVIIPSEPGQLPCKFALLRNRKPGLKEQNILSGMNVFNLGTQKGNIDMESIDRDGLIGSFAGGGLNVEDIPGVAFSPRLYILPGESALSTLLVHNIGTASNPVICLHYNVDDWTSWDAVLHTMSLVKNLELVSMAWGHQYIPQYASSRLASRMLETNASNTKEHAVKALIMQLIPLSEAVNRGNHVRYNSSALLLASLLSSFRNRFFKANYYSADLVMPATTGHFLHLFDECFGLPIECLTMMIRRHESSFYSTIKDIMSFRNPPPQYWEDAAEDFLTTNVVNEKTRKRDPTFNFLRGLISACTFRWQEQVPRATAQNPITTRIPWLLLSSNMSVADNTAPELKRWFKKIVDSRSLSGYSSLSVQSTSDTRAAKLQSADPNQRLEVLEVQNQPVAGSGATLSAVDQGDGGQTEDEDPPPEPYLHLVPETPAGSESPNPEVPAIPSDKVPTGPVSPLPRPPRPPVVTPEKSTSIGPLGLKVFSTRLKAPVRLSDNDTTRREGSAVWYKVTPTLATNPFMFYLLSLFGKVDKPEKTPFFVEVDTVTYAPNAWLWNKFGFEFQIAPSRDPSGTPAKFAFSNNRDALQLQFGSDAPSNPTGYYPKEALLVLARDSEADNSTFATARGAKPTNTPFTFEDLKTFLGFKNPVYLAAFFSDNAQLVVDEGRKGDADPKRNGMWLWPMEAQRVEMRLTLALKSQTDPRAGDTSSNLVKGIIDAIAPGFLVSDSKQFRLIAKKISELDTTGADGTTTKSSCSLDFICPVSVVVNVDGVDVTHKFQLVLSIDKDSTTVRVHKPASTGALGAILIWLGGVIGEKAGIPRASELVDQGQLLFQSDTAEDKAAFTLDFRQVLFTWTGETAGAGTSQTTVQKLTAFSVDLEAQGKIGTNLPNVSSQLTFKWELGKRTAFTGSLWNELWTTKSTTIPKGLTVGYEPFHVLKKSDGTRNSFDLGDLMTNIKLPNFLPTTMQAFYIEVASDGVYLSAIMVAKKPAKDASSVPMVEFSTLRLRALMTSNDTKRTIGLGFSADVSLRTRTPDKYPPALLSVTIEYVNEKTAEKPEEGAEVSNNPVANNTKKVWSVSGTAKNLRAAHLFTLFSDADQANGVMEFIEAWGITTLTINYTFDSTAPSNFKIVGQLAIGKLVLDLTMEASAKAFTLHANIGADAKLAPPTTLGDLLRDLSADVADLLPPFVSEMAVDPSKDFGLELDIAMAPKATKEKPNPEQFLAFNVALTLPKVEISFVQHRSPKSDKAPAEVTRLLRLSFKSFPIAPKVPIVGEVTPTFEQLQFVWASRDVTKKLQDELNTTVYEQDSEKLITKQVVSPDALPAAAAVTVVLVKGCHFLVIARPEGDLVAVIDYVFGSGKAVPKPLPPAEDGEKPKDDEAPKEDPKEDPKPEETPPAADGQLTVAPLKQNRGPLSVSNISFGASPKDSTITIKLDATFQLGPVALGLLGFSVTVHGIGDWESVSASAAIEGMAIEYVKPPMVLAGALRKSGTAYTGAMVLTFPPYQLMAMGSYQSSPFTSLFILALLNGPLAQFEVAEISGVTAGFGYNSRLVLPAPAEVTTHPFLKDLKNVDPGQLMTTLTSGADFWFPKEQGSNWIAAGLTVKAMQTLSVKAVLAVEFGPSVQLSLFAEASAEVPAPVTDTVKPILKAKLGIIGVLNIDKGILKVEGQLAPTSYILDPMCKLVGGFAIAYWFKGSPYEGDWVFSVGGYHPAYVKPEHYPSVSSPVGISWQYSREIMIQGGAYLAVTPQCLMGGGRLSAVVSKKNLFGLGSDIDANFQAWADFLINYQPFRYMGDVGASISLKLKVNYVVATKTYNLNPSAVLHAEGPSFSGSLTVKGIPVLGELTVDFGDGADEVKALDWGRFVDLVMQKPGEDGEKSLTHIISLAEGEISGVDDTPPTKAEKEETDDELIVRTGNLKIKVQSKFPIGSYATTLGGTEKPTASSPISFKPMQTQGNVTSKMTATISPVGKPGTVMPAVFGVEESNVPGGIWGAYDKDKDPSKGTAAARSLLSSSEGALIRHVMALSLSTPDANKGDKATAPWIYFDVKLNKSVEVFDNPDTRPALPEHQPANPVNAPRSLQSPDQALADLKDVWGESGPAINPKEAVDCWMALFHPPSDAIVPERVPVRVEPTGMTPEAPSSAVGTEIAPVEEPTVMLSTLPPPNDPLPGTLPLRTTTKPEEYYLDLPCVSNFVQAAA